MSSEFGKKVKISVFGQSHGVAVGVLIDGISAGHNIDMARLNAFMDRRRPGKSALTTHRSEADAPKFISGVENGKTTGFPICAVIENTDTRSADYSELADVFRPSHADFTAYTKWHGAADMRGGGHFSGRLTAPLCVAGGICMQLLEKENIFVGAHLLSVKNEQDEPFPMLPTKELFEKTDKKDFPVLSDLCGEKMKEVISAASSCKDSVGGVIEAAIIGVPCGMGSPMFDGIENRLASALFGIPAVKGVEFGSGFSGTHLFGSENNDPFCIRDGKIATETNNSGGAQGGISNGMPITVRVAIKPTPSISKPQKSVSISTMAEKTLEIVGRHDPCVALRAVPVVQAVCAAVIYDMISEEQIEK